MIPATKNGIVKFGKALTATIRNKMKKFWSLCIIPKVLRGMNMVVLVLTRTTPGAHLVYMLLPDAKPLLCSNCFTDTGLRLDAETAGILNALPCPNCGSKTGKRLTKHLITYLIRRFFVRGSVVRHKYGAAPWLQFNEPHFRSGTYKPPPWLQNDLNLLSENTGIGVFHYGPRLWMLGEVEPLKKLQDINTRAKIIERILHKFPSLEWPMTQKFFRVRVNPSSPENYLEYDSPPPEKLGKNRLDSPGLPVLYCSQDLEGCIHECRVTLEDEIYLATLEPARPLRLLDLTARIEEDRVTEFESLDMAIHMLFFAAEHSYDISRAIALSARNSGFDGLLYPSYFSQVRSGKMPFETAFGISLRRFSIGTQYAKQGLFPNIALFGHPLAEASIRLNCINRVVLSRVNYHLSYGPVVERTSRRSSSE